MSGAPPHSHGHGGIPTAIGAAGAGVAGSVPHTHQIHLRPGEVFIPHGHGGIVLTPGPGGSVPAVNNPDGTVTFRVQAPVNPNQMNANVQVQFITVPQQHVIAAPPVHQHTHASTAASAANQTPKPSTTAQPPAPPVQLPPQEQHVQLEAPKLSVEAATATTLRLTWPHVAHSSKYIIERQLLDEKSENSDGSDVEVVAESVDTSCIATNLLPNRPYSFRIRVVGGRFTPDREAQLATKKNEKSKAAGKGKGASSSAYSLTADEANKPPVIIVAADSSQSEWTTFSTAPVSVPTLKCASSSKNSLKLTWAACEGANRYALVFIPHSASKQWRSSVSSAELRQQPQKEYQDEELDVIEDDHAVLLQTANALTYTQKGLKPGHNYSFAIRALGAEEGGRDDSDFSNAEEFVTAAAVPNAPSQITRIKSNPNSITLQWTESLSNGAKIVDYTLQRCESTAEAAASQSAKDSWAIEYNGSNTQHTVSNLVGGKIYKFRVKSSNAVGSSPFSAPVSFGTDSSPPDPPMLPSLSSKGGKKQRSLKLEWDEPLNLNGSTLAGYTLMLSTCASAKSFDSSPDLIVEYNSRNTNLEILSLNPGTTYFVKVVANSNLGRSAPSSPALPFTTLPDVPSKPGTLILTDASYSNQQALANAVSAASSASSSSSSTTTIPLVNCSKFGLSWSPSNAHGSPITQYSLLMSPSYTSATALAKASETDENVKWESIATSQQPSLTLPAGVLKYASFLVFKVQATSAMGHSEFSPILKVQTECGPPTTPTAPLAIEKVHPKELDLKWKIANLQSALNGSELKGFNFEVQEKGTAGASAGKAKKQHFSVPFTSITVGVSKSDFSYALPITTLAPNTSYQVRYQLVNVAGPSSFSPFVSFQTCPPLPSAPKLAQVAEEKRKAESLAVSWTHEQSAPAAVTGSKSAPVAAGQFVLQISLQSTPPPAITSKYTQEFKDIYRGPSMNFTLAGLIPAQKYAFRVAAVNQVGQGSWSTMLYVRTRSALPPAPTQLQSVAVGYDDIRVRFFPSAALLQDYENQMLHDATLPPINYRIEMKAGASDDWKVAFEGELQAPPSEESALVYRQKAIKGLQPLTDYNFRVSMSNEEGFGAPSAVLAVATTGVPPPPPMKLSVLIKKDGYETLTKFREAGGSDSEFEIDLPALISWQHGSYEPNTVEASLFVLDGDSRVNYVLSQRIDQGAFTPIYSGPVASFGLNLSPLHHYSFQVTCENAHGVSKASSKSAWKFEEWVEEQEKIYNPGAAEKARKAAAAAQAAADKKEKDRIRAEKAAQRELQKVEAAKAAAAAAEEANAQADEGNLKKRNRGRKKKAHKTDAADEVESEAEEEEEEDQPLPTPAASTARVAEASGPVLTPAEKAKKLKEAKRRYQLFQLLLLAVLLAVVALGTVVYIKKSKK